MPVLLMKPALSQFKDGAARAVRALRAGGVKLTEDNLADEVQELLTGLMCLCDDAGIDLDKVLGDAAEEHDHVASGLNFEELGSALVLD